MDSWTTAQGKVCILCIDEMTTGNSQESGCNEVFQRLIFFQTKKNEADQLF